MTLSDQATIAAGSPFTGLLRAADRERILVQVIAPVWDSILQLPLLLRELQRGPAVVDPADLPLIHGTIGISGAWEGKVSMACPQAFAAKCAAIMHDRRVDELSDGEIADAWGELVNMVGGHLKALVPPVSRLGLPSVRAMDPTDHPAPGGRILNELTFACLGDRIHLMVWQSSQ